MVRFDLAASFKFEPNRTQRGNVKIAIFGAGALGGYFRYEKKELLSAENWSSALDDMIR